MPQPIRKMMATPKGIDTGERLGSDGSGDCGEWRDIAECFFLNLNNLFIGLVVSVSAQQQPSSPALASNRRVGWEEERG